MKRVLLLVFCLLMVMLPVCVFASTPTSIEYIDLQASSSVGTANYTVAINPGDLTSIGATNLLDAKGDKIGTVSWTDDCSSFLNFTAISGTANTTFTVNSAVDFSNLSSAQLDGSASITLTGGRKSGATLDGGFNGSAFTALYNGSAYQTAVQTPFSVGAHDSATQSGDLGTAVYNNVSSLGESYIFTISAGSSASGTSTLDATPVPEPGSMLAICSGLIGMVGMAGVTARRRKE